VWNVRRRLLLAPLLALAFAMAACGSEGVTESASPSVEDLVAPTANGGQIDFNSLEGSDTVLWFWAPW
jgi:hypothetical protein